MELSPTGTLLVQYASLLFLVLVHTILYTFYCTINKSLLVELVLVEIVLH
jgi:hypothetical protein